MRDISFLVTVKLRVDLVSRTTNTEPHRVRGVGQLAVGKATSWISFIHLTKAYEISYNVGYIVDVQ